MPVFKTKQTTKVDIPSEFTNDIIATMSRIEQNISSNGILYIKNDAIVMYTVPRGVAVILNERLPLFNKAVVRAVKEINYILQMKIISNLLKDAQDEKLVKTTASINDFNPMVDRIMDDDSVGGVVMTNKEGAPILTTLSVTHASLYGLILHKYSVMSQMYIKEMDPYEEIVVVRIKTKKHELILAPDPEFLIIVIQQQHSRKTLKHTHVKDKVNMGN